MLSHLVGRAPRSFAREPERYLVEIRRGSRFAVIDLHTRRDLPEFRGYIIPSEGRLALETALRRRGLQRYESGPRCLRVFRVPVEIADDVALEIAQIATRYRDYWADPAHDLLGGIGGRLFSQQVAYHPAPLM